jgi:hypothetical protein
LNAEVAADKYDDADGFLSDFKKRYNALERD